MNSSELPTPEGCPIDMGEEYYKMKHSMGHYYDYPLQEKWDIQVEIIERAIKGDQECIKLMLGQDRVNFGNGYPLHCVARTTNTALIKLLVENGAMINGPPGSATPLHSAARAGHPETIRLLVELGASVDARDSNGETPLHMAAELGHIEAIKTLVELGAPLEAKTSEGKTPLLAAAAKGEGKAVEELISLGANIEAADRTGSVIHIAAWNGFSGLIEWLASKMPVDSRNAQKQTAMHIAAWNNRGQVIKELAKCGADVNAVDEDGETPLFHAAHSNSIYVAKHLLELGANINIKNNKNKTAGQIAAEKQYKEFAKLLNNGKIESPKIEKGEQKEVKSPRKKKFFFF